MRQVVNRVPRSLVVFIFGFVWNYRYATRFSFFQLYDDSLIQDMAWRIASGQKPFLDFSTLEGPTSGIIESVFVLLFGNRPQTSIIRTSAINGAAGALVYLILGLADAGKDPLRLRFDRQAKTYWIERGPRGPAPDSMKNQF